MFERVLDLRGEIVTNVREFVVQGMDEPHGVAGAVQEVRVPEGDVPRTRGDQLADVRQHDVPRDSEEASVVHGRNGTVQAGVQAAATRFNVARRDETSGARQAHVARQGGQPGPARRREGQPLEGRSEEHTSELQSLAYLVCRLLLEK